MRKHLFTITLGVSILGNVSLATPANHVDMTSAILDFLSRTELCLNSCRDADSAAKAIRQLEELKQECDRLVETQRQLPEPTVQDYMAVQNQMEAFNTLCARFSEKLTYYPSVLKSFLQQRNTRYSIAFSKQTPHPPAQSKHLGEAEILGLQKFRKAVIS